MHLLSIIPMLEPERNAQIHKKLTEILGLDVHEGPHNKFTADGVYILVVNRIRLPLLVMELKRELGDSDSDPSHQVGLSMK
jgi:hypothetical protein